MVDQPHRAGVAPVEGRRIHIDGVVQGVGFRPFVFGLAQRLGLTGWVRNTSAGVDIEVDGQAEALTRFVAALSAETPPLAHIDHIASEPIAANGYAQFEIITSAAVAGAFQPISADFSICDDCLRELFDPTDRRYRYPFINCTNCGPRFTIIEDIPYDRPLTTMAPFDMCAACRAEYVNPLDRRFHAQPVACPDCGPHVWLESDGGDKARRAAAIAATRARLAAGGIVAIKGLGGFHLACDATNAAAVAELRRRKLRRDKPFALMMADEATVRRHCWVNSAESALLTSQQRPIVILRRRADSSIATAVAPDQDTLGVMLPYTPLHYLLLERGTPFGAETPILVMTSGNVSEEPIVSANADARQRLGTLADAFLMHDRAIRTRCDDSVLRVATVDDAPTVMPLRRSRGYAPFPVRLPWSLPPLLAAGGELKNTFCITRDRYAFLSHHIGDLENYETLASFEDGVVHFERLFKVTPEVLAYDLHPNYLASRYALTRAEADGVTAVGVQHHHAHVAACMAEHGLPNAPVIGVAFDGTGYGTDGHIWGGEFLVADYASFERALHLAYVPLPGGDRAVQQPWRMALSWLQHAGVAADALHLTGVTDAERDARLRVVSQQIETGLNAPPTSSMGRLFDAVAALVGLKQQVNYEAQAAIALETVVDTHESGYYLFDVGTDIVEAAGVVQAVSADLAAAVAIPRIAARFHNGVARMVVDGCRQLRDRYGLERVVLSGGVWQNVTLLTSTIPRLRAAGFDVYWHQTVPANDGGLALGQALIAAQQTIGLG